MLIYIYSSEKCKIEVGLETLDVFCPRVSWRKYVTFFWKQKYEQLQFALTYNAPSNFLLLTNKVLRFQRGGRAQVAILFPALVSSGLVTPHMWPRGAIAHLTRPAPQCD